MRDIQFTPEASEEYHAELDWYACRSKNAAIQFEFEIQQTINDISSMPTRHAPCEDDDVHRYATVKRYPFVIIFRERLELIEIVAVAHTRKRPSYWRNRVK